MIAFRKPDKEPNILAHLEYLLDEIYNSSSDSMDLNFSEILDLLHHTLYIDNQQSITLNISKNVDNSLSVRIIDSDNEF